MSFDIDKLREVLTDYYGTAAFSGMPAAMMEVFDIQNESDLQLLKRAEENGIDLSKYSNNNGWW